MCAAPATTGLDDEEQGLASGLFNTSQRIGGALGLAMLSTLAASETSSAGGSRRAPRTNSRRASRRPPLQPRVLARKAK